MGARLTPDEIRARADAKAREYERIHLCRQVRDEDAAALRAALTRGDVPTALDACARIARTLGAHCPACEGAGRLPNGEQCGACNGGGRRDE